ncbi:Oidioi.mRNA.OKI2018_I69.chr2.g7126.t1.cds [Oikopleura dioica]|uniref:Oidioi.mRNA.OKI2018_I69.chr2.g7126.t1.cds n=1 Tax=Oikopleura dioica TaxID=34765 RepID=A0ABN7TC54_OIKDI|nr:Oidioi.mRNA.OKI2018_I69.chr2.g7126.t1.cds [Oikopleura dioica]
MSMLETDLFGFFDRFDNWTEDDNDFFIKTTLVERCKAGLIPERHCEEPDKVKLKCEFCDACFSEPDTDDEILATHAMISSDCPLIVSESALEPMIVEFQRQELRLTSLELLRKTQCPHLSREFITKLADEGFYFDERIQMIKCFFCVTTIPVSRLTKTNLSEVYFTQFHSKALVQCKQLLNVIGPKRFLELRDSRQAPATTPVEPKPINTKPARQSPVVEENHASAYY